MQYNLESYCAAVYLRLSKEDEDILDNGCKSVSNSISNQKELIMSFLESKPEIKVTSVRIDDGYTGTNFERPEFQKMLEDVKAGTINCIIVKDLSRFGRNYIEVGKYIEKIFPVLGVRFIAVNDNYDSNDNVAANDMIIPFKNLINDAYCRDISIKIRSSFAMKQKKGDFIGAFATYGYLKSEENKNQLVVDEYAANVVRDIFRYKLEGYSQDKIAQRLNQEGILSPTEYKQSCGQHYRTVFQKNLHTSWSAVAIRRILENELYIGTMVQGRVTTPNYKVKKRFYKKKEDWIRVENTHEPIVTKETFYKVQELLGRDTRTSPKENHVYPLSGLIFCGDCGATMVRKTVPIKGKKYIYYICGDNKKYKTCSSHSIREDQLLDVVFKAIHCHIQQVMDTSEILKNVDQLQRNSFRVKKLQERMVEKQKELQKAEHLKIQAYADMGEELLTAEEYNSIKRECDSRIAKAKSIIEDYEKQIKKAVEDEKPCDDWITSICEFQNSDQLTRKMAVLLISRILIFEGKRIEIKFSFQEEYEDALSIVHISKENQVCRMGDNANG